MKNFIKNSGWLILTLGFLLYGTPAMADEYGTLAKKFSSAAVLGGVKKVAVLGFIPRGDVSQAEADYVAAKIASSLCAAKKVEVVERALTDKMLGERRLMASVAAEGDMAGGLQGLLSADAAVTGAVFADGDGLKIIARLVDTRTGRLIEVFEAGAARRPDAGGDFRDSPADMGAATCGARRAELDRLNREAVAAKAKYWAARIKAPGFSYSTLRRNLGSELRDPETKAEFYRLLLRFTRPDSAPELKGRELAMLHALMPKEDIFYDECGL